MIRRPRRNAVFFPGESQAAGPWAIEFTQTQGHTGFQLEVEVDGSPSGLETIDDLWESYQDDYEAALQAQQERQHEAIEILHPLETAMKGKLPSMG